MSSSSFEFLLRRNGARTTRPLPKGCASAGFGRARRLVCAVWRVNDPSTKPLETKPSFVHYGRGGRIGGVACQGLEAKGKMRSLVVALAGLAFAACTSAQAKVAITVDKDAQQMTVAVDGVERYRWPVSSGPPSYETPNGSFRAFRMEAGSLLQGIRRRADAALDLLHQDRPRHSRHGFGKPSRHRPPRTAACGCRAPTPRRCTRWCKAEGVLNTTVTLTGSSQVALARNPRPRTAAPSRAAIRHSSMAHLSMMPPATRW